MSCNHKLIGYGCLISIQTSLWEPKNQKQKVSNEKDIQVENRKCLIGEGNMWRGLNPNLPQRNRKCLIDGSVNILA